MRSKMQLRSSNMTRRINRVQPMPRLSSSSMPHHRWNMRRLPPGSPELDLTAKLQQLADLHASGVLTDEEFAAAKQKLLAS